LLPHSHGTSLVLGASKIVKGQELDEIDLRPGAQKEATNGTTNGTRLEMCPTTVRILGEALEPGSS
jgi:hypothetical protein